MKQAIVIRNLTWRYDSQPDFTIRDLDFTVQEGEFLGVVGPNEHGKTTLLSCIAGLIPHTYNGLYRGSVELFGHDVRQMDAISLAGQVGFVFADPEAQFTSMTVEEELVFGMENLGFSEASIHERLAWAAKITMIDDLLDKSPYDISGGQKQRVAIAAVLAMKPRILIFDEPTSMLDPLAKHLIFQILGHLRHSREHTIIVAEHNLEQLAALVDRFILVLHGHIVTASPPTQFFEEATNLLELGVAPPEVTRLSYWLRDSGFLPGNLPLALDFPSGLASARLACASLRSRR
jgi:energy-coupling factor transport system ATP-binding protein